MRLKILVFLFGFIGLFMGAGAGGSPNGNDSSPLTNEAGGSAGSSSYFPLEKLVGVYKGIVYGNKWEANTPVTTEFFKGKNGIIIGAYTMKVASGTVEGLLDDIHDEGRNVLTAKWHDNSGSGVLRMVFISEDARRFRGNWGADEQHALMEWTGRKQ